MEQVTHQTVSQLKEAILAMQEFVTQLEGRSEKAAHRLNKAGELVRERSDLVAGAAHQIHADIAQAADHLEERAKDILSAGERSAMQLDQATKSLERKTRAAQVNAMEIKKGFDVAGAAARHQMDELASTVNQTLKEITKASDDLESRNTEVTQISDLAMEKLGAWDDNLKKRSDLLRKTWSEAAHQAHDAAKAMEQQTKSMSQLNRHATDLVKDLSEVDSKVGTDEFMRRHAFVVESLQSLGVDITRELEIGISEEEWRRFTRGDRSIFVRKLAALKDRNKLNAIKDAYRDHEAFRTYANRYFSEFEQLIVQAKDKDQHGILANTFYGSDVGRVYLALCQGLGREPK